MSAGRRLSTWQEVDAHGVDGTGGAPRWRHPAIGINRPEANNRIDPPTYVALGQALYELEHDEELRVGVLHALDPDFVPALDLAAYGTAAMAGTFPAANPRTDIVDPLDMTPPAAQQAPDRRVRCGRPRCPSPGSETWLVRS